MVNSCHVVILLFIRISLTSAKYSKDDKLVLDAVDLIDLIRKEEVSYKHKRSGYDSEAEEESARPLQESSFRGGKSNLASPIIQDPLKQRKVWSKWSKWSACSVTCGTGATMRQRRCAAGRCAAGEREVQIRPCTRPPCNFMPPDDSHDWDS